MSDNQNTDHKSFGNTTLLIFVVVSISILVIVFLLAGNNNNTQSKSNSVFRPLAIECHKDSIAVITAKSQYPNDLRNDYEYDKQNGMINYSHRDENGVWFDRDISQEIRIVFQPQKNILLVYFGENLYKKYSDVAAKDEFTKYYKCVDGKYVYQRQFSNNLQIISNNQQETIITIRQNEDIVSTGIIVFYLPDKTTKYRFYASSDVFKGVK
jgi:hypothetical protein